MAKEHRSAHELAEIIAHEVPELGDARPRIDGDRSGNWFATLVAVDQRWAAGLQDKVSRVATRLRQQYDLA